MKPGFTTSAMTSDMKLLRGLKSIPKDLQTIAEAAREAARLGQNYITADTDDEDPGAELLREFLEEQRQRREGERNG